MGRLLKQLNFLLSRGERWRLGLLLLLMVGGAVLEAVGVGVLPGFLLLLSRPERVLEHAWGTRIYHLLGVARPQDLVWWSAAGLVLLFLVKNSYLTLLSYVRARFVFARQVGISKRLFRTYLEAPYALIVQRNSAELLRNIAYEANFLVMNEMIPLLQVIMDLLVLLLIVGLLLFVEPIITVLAMGVLAGGGSLFLAVVRKSSYRQGLRQQAARARTIQALNQGLGGLKDVRVLGREGFFMRRFLESARETARTSCYRLVVSEMPRRLIELVALISMVLITVLLLARGGGLVNAIPSLVLFSVASIRLMPVVISLTGSINSMHFYRNSLEAVCRDLQGFEGQVPAAANRTKAVKHWVFRRSIRFDRVTFQYPSRPTPALQGINLEIRRGSVVGFVGPSGAGKTTLVDLLLGLLPPSAGSIEADDVNIHDDLRAWQRNLGYVPQTIYLTDDTIRRNIAFGLEDQEIDEARVQMAIRAAQIEEMVEALPKGLQTVVGERGVLLSGGQRQRIGIARALYHNPEVLILDEATSSLDNETERYVLEAIDRLKGDRTIIMIAHRLTTVRNCDVLHFIQAGQLTQSGSYDELLQRSPEFQNMAAYTA